MISFLDIVFVPLFFFLIILHIYNMMAISKGYALSSPGNHIFIHQNIYIYNIIARSAYGEKTAQTDDSF